MSAGPSPPQEASSSSPGSPYFRVDQIPGKGKGLVAVQALPRGTHLAHEKPILLLELLQLSKPETGYSYLSKLNHQQQIAFFSILPRSEEDRNPVASRLHRFSHLRDKKTTVALLPQIGLANHACSPNAMIVWEKDQTSCHLVTIASISVGEEIVVSYIHEPMHHKPRQEFLKNFFGFDCKCRTCTLSTPDRVSQDDRVTRHDELTKSRSATPLGLLSFTRRLASLAITATDDKMFTPTLGYLVENATLFCTMGADEHNAKAWAKLWREWAWFVKDEEKLKEATGFLDPRENDTWGRKVVGQKQKLMPPPDAVNQFFASLELAPTHTALPPPPLYSRQSAIASLEAAASANGSSKKKPSNGSAPSSSLPTASWSQAKESVASVDSSVASNGASSSSSVPAPPEEGRWKKEERRGRVEWLAEMGVRGRFGGGERSRSRFGEWRVEERVVTESE